MSPVLTSVALAAHEPLSGCEALLLLVSSFIDYSGTRRSFSKAAGRGSVHLLEFLASRSVKAREFEAAVLAAVKNRDLVVLQWLFGYRPETRLSARVLDQAAASGGLKFAQWLVDHAPPRSLSCSHQGALYAAERGDLVMLQWLEELFYFEYAPSVLDAAARGGYLEVVEFLHRHKAKCTARAMNAAAVNGHLNVVAWLHANRKEGCEQAAMDGAAANGYLSVVQWLHEHRAEGCTTNAMDCAAWRGHLDVVQWLHEHRSEGCSGKALPYAADCGHLSVVKFLVENRLEGSRRLAVLRAASNGHLEVLQYLLQACPEAADHREEIIALARQSEHWHVAQWLQEHQCSHNSHTN